MGICGSLNQIVPHSELVPDEYLDDKEIPACDSNLNYAMAVANGVHRRDILTDAYEPSFSETFEELTDSGVWKVGDVIASSKSSFVHVVSQRWRSGGYVLKYFSNCWSSIKSGVKETRVEPGSTEYVFVTDPLVREYAIGAVLSRKGIFPRFRFISGPTVWDSFFSQRFALHNRASALRCQDQNATVRFMIMDKTGPSLGRHFRSMQPVGGRVSAELRYLKKVLLATRAALNVLKGLHETGAIHGDIHGGNIALKRKISPNHEQFDLILLDPGLSSFVCGSNNEEIRHTGNNLALSLLSMWQYTGSRIKGFRDDVFRLFEWTANALSMGALRAMGEELSEGMYDHDGDRVRRFFAAFKEQLQYFSSNTFQVEDAFAVDYDPFSRYRFLSVVFKLSLGNCLNQIMSYIKGIADPLEQIDFELLTQLIEGCIGIVASSLNA